MKNTFRSLFLLQVYMFGVMVTMSCSKNESEVTDDSTTPVAEYSFYQYTQVPGSDPNNGLVAKQVLNESGDEIFFYGSFDASGMPQAPKSFVVQKASTDTVMNTFVDEFMRPTMIYFSNVNGTKYSTLWTYEWITNTTFIFRAFTYDWLTETDNLNYESFVTYDNGQYTFDDNFVRSSSAVLNVQAMFDENMSYRGGGNNWVENLTNVAVATGIIAVGVGLVATVGIYGAVAYGVGTGLAAAGILATALLVGAANAAEATPPTTNNNSDLPNNPNDAPNPDPQSTPEDPTNLLTTTDGTSGTTATTDTTGTSGTTGTTSLTTTTTTTGTTGTNGTTGTTSTTNTTATTDTTGDTLGGMIIQNPRLLNQVRQDIYDVRRKK